MFITNKDVSLSTVKPYAGQNVKITAKVRNKGAAANSSLVSFYQGDPQNEGQLIATKKLDALSYLGSQEIECSWPTGSIPQQQEIHVVVDPLNKIEEGKYQVKYKSVDKVGNQEQENNLTVIIDETAPETTVKTTGDKWSDGWFKTAPQVTLSAQDNLEGSGVDEIYYRYGEAGEVHKYSEPFTINEEGITELYVYAVDNNGNQEIPYKTEIKFVKPWSAPYNLLVQKLSNNGNVKVDRAFSNRAVSIKGNCQLNYVGTAQSEIDRRGNVTIESLATDLSYQSLPQPDWEALENITTLKTDKKIKDAVSNVKYKNNLKISGKGEVQGILVVDGDLEISGKTRFPNTGIFCTGEVIISGNPEITGVIYAGDGLKMSGTPEVNGALVVDGSATISGSVESNQVKIKEYLDYLRKTDSEQ